MSWDWKAKYTDVWESINDDEDDEDEEDDTVLFKKYNSMPRWLIINLRLYILCTSWMTYLDTGSVVQLFNGWK